MPPLERWVGLFVHRLRGWQLSCRLFPCRVIPQICGPVARPPVCVSPVVSVIPTRIRPFCVILTGIVCLGCRRTPPCREIISSLSCRGVYPFLCCSCLCPCLCLACLCLCACRACLCFCRPCQTFLILLWVLIHLFDSFVIWCSGTGCVFSDSTISHSVVPACVRRNSTHSDLDDSFLSCNFRDLIWTAHRRQIHRHSTNRCVFLRADSRACLNCSLTNDTSEAHSVVPAVLIDSFCCAGCGLLCSLVMSPPRTSFSSP